jgi:hypothetical protein
MPDGDITARLADLDARLRVVEATQDLILRIMATTRPLDSVLEHYGATETQERAFYTLLDELVARARGREQDRPTLAYFQMKLAEIFPALRNDRVFTQVVLDTLRLERPAYRELHAYTAAHGWATEA